MVTACVLCSLQEENELSERLAELVEREKALRAQTHSDFINFEGLCSQDQGYVLIFEGRATSLFVLYVRNMNSYTIAVVILVVGFNSCS